MGESMGMRYYRSMIVLAMATFAAALAMFVGSAWAGERLGGPIYTARLAQVLILLAVLLPSVARTDRGTLPRRLWLVIALAVALAVAPVAMETANAYLGREHFSQDIVFLFYLLVFIPVLVAVGIFYFGFRKLGFAFRRKATWSVLPSLAVFVGVTVAFLIVPMARGGGDAAVKASDIFSLVVQIGALCVISLMAVTIGRGEAGRPYVWLALALACIIIQTILTAHIRLVGIMHTNEPADIFVHLGYLFLTVAAYHQGRLAARVGG